MKLGIITYKANHLKTEQIVNVLIRHYNPKDISMYALPFIQRPKRNVIFEHRPPQDSGIDTEKLARSYGISYKYCPNGDSEIDDGSDIYLIAGAGIISKECVERKKIINCHPGIIPLSRGLDSFKWAIYDLIPVGVSLHYIDASVDFGEVITVEKTPLFHSDSLLAFARRHYELEIEMLSHFEYYLSNGKNEYIHRTPGDAHMRMKTELEQRLEERFCIYKDKFAEI